MTDLPSPTPTPPTPAAPARQPPKWRLYLLLGVIVAFLGIVLWVVRDNQSVADLSAGTCFDLPSRGGDISTVTRHACTEAHDAEVFHVAEYTGSSYPISLSLNSFIDSACVPVFTTYVGTKLSSTDDLTIGYFYPARDGWDSGDRTITCYAVRVDDAKLTKSLKGSAGS